MSSKLTYCCFNVIASSDRKVPIISHDNAVNSSDQQLGRRKKDKLAE